MCAVHSHVNYNKHQLGSIVFDTLENFFKVQHLLMGNVRMNSKVVRSDGLG
jgi:hypothetical protein